MSREPGADAIALAEARARARAVRRFAVADALREELAASGWAVIDEPGGIWRLEPVGSRASSELGAASSVEAGPPLHDASVHWVDLGWPADVARAIASFRAHEDGRNVRYVVAELAGADPSIFGDEVDVVSLEPETGWAAAMNAGLRLASGRLVLVMDGAIEVTGDLFDPFERALADPGIGLAGPFGIVTNDLRSFRASPEPGPCDAVEAYCIAMRREVLAGVGGFDERFHWYRSADIELSFRVKDRGLRTEVVAVPVVRHEHRMWSHTSPADREKLSKRNFYRFLDVWRDRWDLVLDPRPPDRG